MKKSSLNSVDVNETVMQVIRQWAKETPVYPSLPVEDLIRVRAYQLWEQAGSPESDGVSFWLEAEQQLTGSIVGQEYRSFLRGEGVIT